jgi:hypothetical protein
MPEIDQYTFKHQEVVEALIKKAGLHEGKWQLTMNFGLAGVNIGPNPNEMVPAAAIGILNIGLLRAQPDSPPSLVADAAVINPAST